MFLFDAIVLDTLGEKRMIIEGKLKYKYQGQPITIDLIDDKDNVIRILTSDLNGDRADRKVKLSERSKQSIREAYGLQKIRP